MIENEKRIACSVIGVSKQALPGERQSPAIGSIAC